MKTLFFEFMVGTNNSPKLTMNFMPFTWDWGLQLRPYLRLDLGPLMLRLKVLFLILITGSIASAATPPWTGTPPNAIYRQPVQITRYQPGVRTYYRSQHIQVPGFGTLITNEYRHAQTYQRTGRTGSGQSGLHNHGRTGPGRYGQPYPYYRR